MSDRFLSYYTQPHKQPKRGKKDDCIKELKAKNEELTKGLEFAMTLIPKDKLPQGISYQSFRWLINRGREMKYIEPRMLGVGGMADETRHK